MHPHPGPSIIEQKIEAEIRQGIKRKKKQKDKAEEKNARIQYDTDGGKDDAKVDEAERGGVKKDEVSHNSCSSDPCRGFNPDRDPPQVKEWEGGQKGKEMFFTEQGKGKGQNKGMEKQQNISTVTGKGKRNRKAASPKKQNPPSVPLLPWVLRCRLPRQWWLPKSAHPKERELWWNRLGRWDQRNKPIPLK